MSAYSARQMARKNGYRSGLEDKVATYLKELNIKFSYESLKIEWEDLTYRTYTPDFILNNGIIIETKGRFLMADRRKHLCIKKQHPKLDIRFVFENSRKKLRKGGKMTYAQWCMRNNIQFYDRIIPEDWLKEKPKRLTTKNFISFKDKKIKRSYI